MSYDGSEPSGEENLVGGIFVLYSLDLVLLVDFLFVLPQLLDKVPFELYVLLAHWGLSSLLNFDEGLADVHFSGVATVAGHVIAACFVQQAKLR